jgi:hypothetical protein
MLNNGKLTNMSPRLLEFMFSIICINVQCEFGEKQSSHGLGGGGTRPPATLRVINFAVVLVQKTPLLKKITTYAELKSLRVSKELPQLILVPHFSINSGWLSATQLTSKTAISRLLKPRN